VRELHPSLISYKIFVTSLVKADINGKCVFFNVITAPNLKNIHLWKIKNVRSDYSWQLIFNLLFLPSAADDVTVFVSHLKFLEVQNLDQTCFSGVLMINLEMNDSIVFNVCLLTFFFRCDLMTRCWAQEPHNRPTFSYIQDKLQETRHSPLCFIHYLEDKKAATGVINQAFEGESGPAPAVPTTSAPWTVTKWDSAFLFIVFVTASNSLPVKWEQQRLASLIMNL